MFSLLAVAALQAANPISVSTLTGAALATECAKREGLELDTCVSYILGVADALQMDGKTCHGASSAWTLQTVTIARRFINEHPELWDDVPADLVRAPLMKAFPCPWTKYQKR